MNNTTRPRFYGFIYLIYLREFINTNKDIYKIGCCEDMEQRKRQYPKGSILLFSRFTTNYMEIETKIKEMFKEKYIPRRDCGVEYFEGDHHEMIDDMSDIAKNINTYRKNEYKNEVINKKTLKDFVDETFTYDKNKTNTGVNSDIVRKYYTNIWLKENNVDIPLHNLNEFFNKIAKIIGRPVNNIYIGRFFKDRNINLELLNEIDNFKEHDINFYNDFIDLKLELVDDKKSRLKRSDINNEFIIWMKKHPVYKKQINDFDIKILKDKIENKFGTMNESLHLPEGKVNKGWMYIKLKMENSYV